MLYTDCKSLHASGSLLLPVPEIPAFEMKPSVQSHAIKYSELKVMHWDSRWVTYGV